MSVCSEPAGSRALSLRRAPSPVLVVGAIGSVQFGAALAKTLFDQLGPAGIVFLRLAFGALLLSVASRPRVSGRTRRELALAAVFGLVLVAMNMSFYEAVDRIPLGVAVALEFVGPLTVALLGSRRRFDLLWALLALVGIALLTRDGTHGLDAFGVLLALLAGGCWGIYIVLNARLGQAFDGASGVALAMCLGALVAAPFGIAAAGSQLLVVRLLALGAAVGLLSSAIPYSFEAEALRRIAPAVFGVLMSLEPAVAALAGLLVLGQQLAARALVGIVLVVLASIGAARYSPAPPVSG
jgi:inner membrane transporter RhtA